MPDDPRLDAVVQPGQGGVQRAMIGHKPRWLSLQEGSGRARKNSPPAPLVLDPMTPRRSLEPLPPRLQRKIAARWKEWEPWVWIELRHRGIAPGGSPELARLRQRHSDHIVKLTDAGVSMRLIRRHRLDNPRITDDVRAVLVRAARERQRKAWRAGRHLRDEMAQLWGDGIRNRALSMESPHTPFPNPRNILPSPEGAITIASIKKHVCELFYLREMRDPELTVHTNRRAYVFPRQLAMYIVRQPQRGAP